MSCNAEISIVNKNVIFVNIKLTLCMLCEISSEKNANTCGLWVCYIKK
jgi:hypothetical protein